jgi:predicted TIM-barrel fold metal-dependent hydrolase
VIDDHAHPFPVHYAPLRLEDVTLDLHRAPSAVLPSGEDRLWAELATVQLAALLAASPEEVVEARDERARADWGQYLQLLFDDAGIDGMIIDEGVPATGSGPLEAMIGACGRPMWRLARIDPLVDDLVGRRASAAEIVAGVEKYMDDAAAAGAVGYKTILAYRTGLAVDPDVSVAEAEASVSGTDGPVRRRGKAMRDLVTRLVLERAADHGLPVQVHTGFGDSEIRLAEANPLLLEELLRSPAGSRADVVLIHGGYPWHEQVAYLATVRPNVYAELSLSNLFAPLTVADRLRRMVELAPAGKLLAGSDGHHLPETHWFGCKMIHRAFDHMEADLGAAGARKAWIERTRQAVLEGNARRLYRLGEVVRS